MTGYAALPGLGSGQNALGPNSGGRGRACRIAELSIYRPNAERANGLP